MLLRSLCSLALLIGCAGLPVRAGEGPEPNDPGAVAPAPPAVNHERMFGVMPEYSTVRDPYTRYTPLTPGQKWRLVGLSVIDPFNAASAVLGAGLSQISDETPRYGRDPGAYGMRVGAALGDFVTQSAFSGGLAVLFHQDPRYFRKGPGYNVLHRVAYSVSRLVVTRSDTGNWTFNSSGVFGMALGIAASNAYYPSTSRTGTVMVGRLQTSLTGDIIGNLMSEFWPDIHSKLFHHHPRTRP